MLKCIECGHVFPDDQANTVTVYEDWGDVCCYKCPRCGRIEYEGMELFTKATKEETEAKGEMYVKGGE